MDHMKTYPKPDGYQEISLSEMKFDYKSREESMNKNQEIFYVKDITDSQQVYKDREGRNVLILYARVPTFDSSDREWDSYRKLYLTSRRKEIIGVLVRGGYRISDISTYRDIQYADEKQKCL